MEQLVVHTAAACDAVIAADALAATTTGTSASSPTVPPAKGSPAAVCTAADTSLTHALATRAITTSTCTAAVTDLATILTATGVTPTFSTTVRTAALHGFYLPERSRICRMRALSKHCCDPLLQRSRIL